MVRPEWLTSSASLGTLLPWANFIFRSEDRAGAVQGTKAAQKSLFHNFATASSSARTELSLSSDAVSLAAVSMEDEKDDIDALEVDEDPEPTPPTPPPAQPRPQSSSPRGIQDVSHISEPSEPSHHDPDGPIPDSNAPARPAYAAHDSNPHARRAMADPSWRAAHTSVAPDFVEKYYQNSRLHHLATWKAELRNLVAEALAKAENAVGEASDQMVVKDGEEEALRDAPVGVSMRGAELVAPPPGKQRAAEPSHHFQPFNTDTKVIMHLDFDAFFVSAGLVSRPQLRGKPVVVCHSQGSQGSDASTSEIASASYEARAFGVKNGMRCAGSLMIASTSLT